MRRRLLRPFAYLFVFVFILICIGFAFITMTSPDIPQRVVEHRLDPKDAFAAAP